MQTSPQPHSQPWKSTVAGVLTLVIGAIDVLACLGSIVTIIVFNSSPRFVDYIEDQVYPMTTDFFTGMMIFAAVVFGIAAIVAILGAISALQRKRWGLALAGAIVSIIGPWWPIGITGTVFAAIARDEFK
jgi:hypothetical protein